VEEIFVDETSYKLQDLFWGCIGLLGDVSAIRPGVRTTGKGEGHTRSALKDGLHLAQNSGKLFGLLESVFGVESIE
jgi:hypothetical protein